MLLTLRSIKKGWHVTWLDNFSKFYGCDMQGISQGAWKECLWTGKAVMSVPMRGCAKQPPLVSEMNQPAIPSDLFHDEHIKSVAQDCVNRFKKDRHDFHSKSISVLLGVNTIPPKPTIQDGMNPDLEARLLEVGDGLESFHPDSVLGENIGSNDGLMHILRDMYDEFNKKPADERRLQILVMDVNIYKRTVKVTSNFRRCSFHVICI